MYSKNYEYLLNIYQIKTKHEQAHLFLLIVVFVHLSLMKRHELVLYVPIALQLLSFVQYRILLITPNKETYTLINASSVPTMKYRPLLSNTPRFTGKGPASSVSLSATILTSHIFTTPVASVDAIVSP